jgi:hypothetical protein
VFSRLGEPEQVAEAAIVGYRQRSFVGRHPLAAFLVFAVSPVLSMLAVGAAVVAAFVVACDWLGLGEALRQAFWQLGPLAAATASYGAIALFVVVPSVVLTILYCRLAERLCISRKWMFASCAALAVVAAALSVIVRLSDVPGQSELTYSMGIGVSALPSVRQLIQLAIPLAVGLWCMRHGRDAGQPRLADETSCRTA